MKINCQEGIVASVEVQSFLAFFMAAVFERMICAMTIKIEFMEEAIWIYRLFS